MQVAARSGTPPRGQYQWDESVDGAPPPPPPPLVGLQLPDIDPGFGFQAQAVPLAQAALMGMTLPSAAQAEAERMARAQQAVAHVQSVQQSGAAASADAAAAIAASGGVTLHVTAAGYWDSMLPDEQRGQPIELKVHLTDTVKVISRQLHHAAMMQAVDESGAFCIQNYEFCIENLEFSFENDEFRSADAGYAADPIGYPRRS